MAQLPPAVVNDRNTPNDPLHDRRGDLMGRNAILFAVALLAAIAAVAVVLIAFRPQDSVAQPSPSLSPSPSVRLSSATSGSPTPSPSTPAPSRSIAPTAEPSPTQPSIGVPFALEATGGPSGTVEVSAPVPRQRVNGRPQQAPAGSSSGSDTKRPSRSVTGQQIGSWRTMAGPHTRVTRSKPHRLGASQIEARDSAEGTVTFAVPEGRGISAIVLTDGPDDRVSFGVP